MTLQAKQQKKLLREKLNEARKSVSSSQRIDNEKSILKHALELNQYVNSKRIGIYLNTPSEVSTNLIIEHANSQRKSIYCPYIENIKTGIMSFKHWSLQLKENDYGIKEPEPSAPSIDARELDIIFMPLVGFDTNGERLGMGGGFYDRLLEFKQQTNTPRTQNIKPLLVGLAFEAQKSTDLPTQPWDIMLDAVLTERKSYIFNPVVN